MSQIMTGSQHFRQQAQFRPFDESLTNSRKIVGFLGQPYDGSGTRHDFIHDYLADSGRVAKNE
jgi:hypothetical protein